MPAIREERPWQQGFDAYYRRDILPVLERQESNRRRLQRNRFLALGAGVGLALILFCWWWLVDMDQSFLLVIAGVSIFGGIWAAVAIGGDFSGKVKAFVVGKTCDFFGLHYDRRGHCLTLDSFDRFGLLPSYDRSSIEDGIAGPVAGIHSRLIEAHLQQRHTTTDSRGRRKVHYHTCFRGQLMAFELPRPIRGRVVVLRDAGAIGNWLGGLLKSDQRIRLEDPGFERLFEVYGDDQVGARTLLTPRMMERLVALAEHVPGGRIQAAFDRALLYLAVDSRIDGFEAGGLSGPLTDPQRVQTVLSELAVLWDVVEILNLQADRAQTDR